MTDQTLRLSPDPIPQESQSHDAEEGAEARFLGIVRATEDGNPILGIDYSAYEPMALKQMERIAAQAQAQFGPHRLFLQHRTGFVTAGEPSIVIRVCTRHSAAAFEICQWYLKEIKATAPIWKQVVYLKPGAVAAHNT